MTVAADHVARDLDSSPAGQEHAVPAGSWVRNSKLGLVCLALDCLDEARGFPGIEA